MRILLLISILVLGSCVPQDREDAEACTLVAVVEGLYMTFNLDKEVDDEFTLMINGAKVFQNCSERTYPCLYEFRELDDGKQKATVIFQEGDYPEKVDILLLNDDDEEVLFERYDVSLIWRDTTPNGSAKCGISRVAAIEFF